MDYIRRRITLFFILICISAAAQAQEISPEAKADSLFSFFSKSERPSAAITVMQKDSVLLEKYYGNAQINNTIPAQANTNYPIGNISNHFTAVGIMMLKEDGKLSYDDNVYNILSNFPEYGRQITVKNLLQQTSGLPRFSKKRESLLQTYKQKKPFLNWYYRSSDVLRNEDVLNFLNSQSSLEFSPGKTWKYNPVNYIILAEIIEAKSGMSYRRFIKKNIFKPLEMNNSEVVREHFKPNLSNIAYGYFPQEDNNTFEQHFAHVRNKLYGSTGIYTNINDFQKWIAGLSQNKLLSSKTFSQALDMKFFYNVTRYYGFGWYLEFHNHGKLYAYQGNNTLGTTHLIMYIPQEDLYTVIFTNHGAVFGMHEKAMELINMFSEKTYKKR